MSIRPTRAALEAIFPAHESRESFAPGRRQFRELHLYHGNRCNRACDFCTVEGEPAGWHQPFAPETLDAVREWLAVDGNLKIYGGEPTLDLPNLRGSMAYLRRAGFRGWFTLFSNGVLAERVLALLRQDERSEVVLNGSILLGLDAEPLPLSSLAQLTAFAGAHPGRLFRSHTEMVPVGRQAGRNGHAPAFGGDCPRCHPALTSRGLLHACPFAVEETGGRYDLGSIALTAEAAVDAYERFREWIQREVEPAARRAGRAPCVECVAQARRAPALIPAEALA